MEIKKDEEIEMAWNFWSEINPLVDKNNLNLNEQQALEILNIFQEILLKQRGLKNENKKR